MRYLLYATISSFKVAKNGAVIQDHRAVMQLYKCKTRMLKRGLKLADAGYYVTVQEVV